MRMFKGKVFGSDCVHSIISRLGREAVGCLAGMSMTQLCKDSEPRPPETTEALMYGWPPQGALQYRVKLASHERAAVVQRLAEFRWLPNLSFCYGVFVAGKSVESLSLSACRVTADSATAAKGALIKPVYGSVANTTVSISKASTDDEIMRTGNRLIVDAKRTRK